MATKKAARSSSWFDQNISRSTAITVPLEMAERVQQE